MRDEKWIIEIHPSRLAAVLIKQGIQSEQDLYAAIDRGLIVPGIGEKYIEKLNSLLSRKIKIEPRIVYAEDD